MTGRPAIDTFHERIPMSRLHLPALLLTILALLLTTPRPAQAAQSYDNCTGFITTLPTIISTQGTWCLKQDLATSISSGNAITINTNNVTIDCNDFKLDDSAAGTATTAYGIYELNRNNAAVRHCNIRGFYAGVYFDGVNGGGHSVEDNLLDRNTILGIEVYGDGSVIQRNRVVDTGGTTFSPTITTANGIDSVGTVDLIDNLISGATATSGHNGSAYGMYIYGNVAGRIVGNRIRGLKKDGSGIDYGIVLNSGTHVAVRDNELVGDASTGSLGIQCAAAAVDIRGNMLSGFAIGNSGCVDNGNDIVP